MSGAPSPETPHRREDDKGWLCWIARVAGLAWDFVDRRQIDCWVVTIFTGLISWKLTEFDIEVIRHWMLHGERSGSDIALIIGAVNTPWALLQGAAVKFVFDARQGSFDGK